MTAAAFADKALGSAKRQYFLSHLHQATAAGRAVPPRWGSYESGGRSYWVLWAPPPSELRYRVRVPPGARLTFQPALGPASRLAVTFAVDVVTPERSDTILAETIEPGDKRIGAQSQAPSVALSPYEGRVVEIVFRTTGGDPEGPPDGAGWIEPGLL